MLDEKKRTFHTHPSLFPLRMALIAAERESPPCIEPNEQRALKLIQRMKTEYQKPLPFTIWNDHSNLQTFRLQEVIGTDAR